MWKRQAQRVYPNLRFCGKLECKVLTPFWSILCHIESGFVGMQISSWHLWLRTHFWLPTALGLRDQIFNMDWQGPAWPGPCLPVQIHLALCATAVQPLPWKHCTFSLCWALHVQLDLPGCGFSPCSNPLTLTHFSGLSTNFISSGRTQIFAMWGDSSPWISFMPHLSKPSEQRTCWNSKQPRKLELVFP